MNTPKIFLTDEEMLIEAKVLLARSFDLMWDIFMEGIMPDITETLRLIRTMENFLILYGDGTQAQPQGILGKKRIHE